jgi:hypothetical protein
MPKTKPPATVDQFYGLMILAYIQDKHNGGLPDIDILPCELDITEDEAKMGLDWCLIQGVLTLE